MNDPKGVYVDVLKSFDKGKQEIANSLRKTEEQIKVLKEKLEQWELIQKKIKENTDKVCNLDVSSVMCEF